MKKLQVSLLMLALISFIGCAKDGSFAFNKKEIGMMVGSVGGALIGAQLGGGAGQIVTIIGTTLLSGYLGYKVGEYLDEQDLAYLEATSQYSLENNRSGVSSHWTNPDTGHQGNVTPKNTFAQGDTFCRNYTQSVVVEDRVESADGTACRQTDGSWVMVNVEEK